METNLRSDDLIIQSLPNNKYKEKQQFLFDIKSIYEEHWVDMPEFKNTSLAAKSVHIHFKTERDFSIFCEKLGIKINKYSIWYSAK